MASAVSREWNDEASESAYNPLFERYGFSQAATGLPGEGNARLFAGQLLMVMIINVKHVIRQMGARVVLMEQFVSRGFPAALRIV